MHATSFRLPLCNVHAWSLVHLLLFHMTGLLLVTVIAQIHRYYASSLRHGNADAIIAYLVTILLAGKQLPAISSPTTAYSERANASR
jgi:hypothetical protein